MKTIKRPLPNLTETKSIKNYNKFFNQLNFGGIVHGQDIYALNQQSFAEAKNVYVDDGSLVSRPTLQEDKSLPDWVVPEGHTLVEILDFENITVYVTSYHQELLGVDIGEYYRIVINSIYVIEDVKKYKLATISHYIICFNNLGAKVFDINNRTDGWKPLSDFVDIPVTKRVIGSLETILPGNEFTQSYKEEYIWSNASHPILPKNETASVEVNTTSKKYKLTIPNTDILTDYRILRQLERKISEDALFSTAKGIVCFGYDDYFYISYNQGETFSRITYPAHNKFLNVASISDDGQYYFFVATDGVYRCNLSDRTWTVIETGTTNEASGPVHWQIPEDRHGIFNCCHFLTGDIFAFILSDDNGSQLYVYEYGPGLMGDDQGKADLRRWTVKPGTNRTFKVDEFDDVEKECLAHAIKVSYDSSNTWCSLGLIWPVLNDEGIQLGYGLNHEIPINATHSRITGTTIILGNKDTVLQVQSVTQLDISQSPHENTVDGIKVSMFGYYGGNWKDFTYTAWGVIEQNESYHYVIYSSTAESNKLNLTSKEHFPYKLLGGWIQGFTVYDEDITVSANIPVEVSGSGTYKLTWVYDDYFYLVIGDTIWTNQLLDTDIATLTYTYLSEEDKFEDVPTVTYSDTELYMAFENKLRITQNTYNEGNIIFNLPKINDQSFVSPINAMLNISTTEVALFFRDKVVLASKVEDETFGYRYDYNNTRLSVGVRLGDSVINTLEGQYTVFPTRRGLAFMSYQEFMATTDQTLTYVSNDIRDLWTEFYDASESIEIMQWRDYLMLTNGTKQILLLYLTTSSMSWWRWELPVKVKSMLTNQVDFKLIADTLCIFKEDKRYWDFPRTAKQKRISWTVLSQPLHMEAPNYYKSIRQLIFQLVETTDEKATITAQVKLYRKRLTIREPEVIAFKIDELRTFVKRFNYWKVNELQWGLADDGETVIPAQLKLNGVSVKYEFGEEVR